MDSKGSAVGLNLYAAHAPSDAPAPARRPSDALWMLLWGHEPFTA